MTSEARTPRSAVPGRGRAFVWTWPAGRTRPVVAGALARDGDRYRFNYARSWLARADAVPLHVPELPLVAGAIDPLPGLAMAGALRDASPDAWGRRVIAASLAAEPDELDCLLLSGSDRIGGLDFQVLPDAWARRHLVSALTLLELDEMMARYASYERLADLVRRRFDEPGRTLRELFGRLVFDVLAGNTDDHARNHAAFVDGERLALTPAYDLCPQPRTGNVASQAMRIVGERADSTLATCVASASVYRLSTSDAVDIVRGQVLAIVDAWPDVSAEAALDDATRRGLWRRAVLNPYAFEGDAPWLAELRDRVRDASER